MEQTQVQLGRFLADIIAKPPAGKRPKLPDLSDRVLARRLDKSPGIIDAGGGKHGETTLQKPILAIEQGLRRTYNPRLKKYCFTTIKIS